MTNFSFFNIWRKVNFLSYLDRPALFSILNDTEQLDIESMQWKAYLYFQQKANQLNEENIHIMVNCALHKMSVTLCVIRNEVNLSQVYLWLQEKSLFSMGALLHNPSPGESLRQYLSHNSTTTIF